MPVRKNITARQKTLRARLKPVNRDIRVRQKSIKERSLRPSTYGCKLNRNAQTEDFIGGAYGHKIPVRRMTFHLQILTASSYTLNQPVRGIKRFTKGFRRIFWQSSKEKSGGEFQGFFSGNPRKFEDSPITYGIKEAIEEHSQWQLWKIRGGSPLIQHREA